MAKKKQPVAEILCWVFFVSKFNLTNMQMTLALNLCKIFESLGSLNTTPTLEEIKITPEFREAYQHLNKASLSDENIQRIIDFKS